MKYSTLFLTILLLSAALIASVPNNHAAYVSGSAAIPNGTDGSLNLEDGKELRFDYDGGPFKLPYGHITSIEVGDKAGIKAHLAVAVSWIPKFGKKQGRLLTIGYAGENGNREAAIFEISKQEFQTAAPILEARTGKRIQYQDSEEQENASKHDFAVQPPAPVSPLVPVTINSTPNGALVSFWGQPAGKTPLVTKLMPGDYTMSIKASGLPTWSETFIVEPGKPITISAQLSRPAGTKVAAR